MVELHELLADWLKRYGFNYEVVSSAGDDIKFIRRIGLMHGVHYGPVVHVYATHIVLLNNMVTLRAHSPTMIPELEKHLDKCEFWCWKKYPNTALDTVIAANEGGNLLRRCVRILYAPFSRLFSRTRLGPLDIREKKLFRHPEPSL